MSDTELLPKSNAAAVRRLEVFTGAGRRRAWSADQKGMIVAESYSCGESISVIARRHGLTPQQLFAAGMRGIGSRTMPAAQHLRPWLSMMVQHALTGRR